MKAQDVALTEAGALMVAALPRLRRYARALVGDRAAADDLVQDTLERAWARIDSDEIRINIEQQSAALRAGLAAINDEFGLFSAVRGRGLMLGAVLKPEYAGRAGDILDAAARHGLLLLQAGPEVLRFVPALNIGDDDVRDGLRRLRAALAEFAAG